MMRHAILTTTLLLAAVTATGCGSGNERAKDGMDASADGAPRRTVRVSAQPHLSQAPMMIAAAEGFFRDEGLDIEFVPAMRAQETLVALVTGDIDVRPGPMAAGFLSAIAQKAPIRAVADAGYLAKDGCTYFAIMLRNGLDTAGSPPIKRMRTSQDGVSRFIVEQLLRQRRISLTDIESVSVPEAVMAGSLQSGAIDAIATTEPTISRLSGVSRPWLAGQSVTPDQQWGVIAFSERLLTKDREDGMRFMRAYRRGVAQFLQGRTPRNIEILSQGTSDPAEVIRDACWPSFKPDSRINWPSVERFQVWARANTLMELGVTESQVWDSTFLVATDSAAASRK